MSEAFSENTIQDPQRNTGMAWPELSWGSLEGTCSQMQELIELVVETILYSWAAHVLCSLQTAPWWGALTLGQVRLGLWEMFCYNWLVFSLQATFHEVWCLKWLSQLSKLRLLRNLLVLAIITKSGVLCNSIFGTLHIGRRKSCPLCPVCFSALFRCGM